jgi:hypothetical protein
LTGCELEEPEYGIDVAEHMGLGAAERRNPQIRELGLQSLQIAASKGEVVDEVPGTFAERRVDVEIRQELALERQHLVAKVV